MNRQEIERIRNKLLNKYYEYYYDTYYTYIDEAIINTLIDFKDEHYQQYKLEDIHKHIIENYI